MNNTTADMKSDKVLLMLLKFLHIKLSILIHVKLELLNLWPIWTSWPSTSTGRRAKRPMTWRNTSMIQLVRIAPTLSNWLSVSVPRSLWFTTMFTNSWLPQLNGDLSDTLLKHSISASLNLLKEKSIILSWASLSLVMDRSLLSIKIRIKRIFKILLELGSLKVNALLSIPAGSSPMMPSLKPECGTTKKSRAFWAASNCLINAPHMMWSEWSREMVPEFPLIQSEPAITSITLSWESTLITTAILIDP